DRDAVAERLGRHDGTPEVARHDGADAALREACGKPSRLLHAARAERDVRTLHHAGRVRVRLAVPDEDDRADGWTIRRAAPRANRWWLFRCRVDSDITWRMRAAAPQRTRVYRCHHLDSTRWDDVVPRPDDVVITTSLKAGTTWTQRIVSLLVFQTRALPNTLHWVSPWPDSRFIIGRAEMRAVVEGLTHRRFLKSHLPLDSLPYWASTKYIYVARDTRDI